jgi:hypothetical protein
MLGLRLDEPLPLAPVAEELDARALSRLERLGLARRTSLDGAVDVKPGEREGALTLTTRGRLLGDAVTADLLT